MKIMKICSETITLRELIGDRINEFQLIWQLINYSDLDIPLEVKTFSVEEVKGLKLYNQPHSVWYAAERADEERWEIINNYINNPPFGKDDIIIIYGGKGLVDGHHRTAAAIQTGRRLRYVDLRDLPQ